MSEELGKFLTTKGLAVSKTTIIITNLKDMVKQRDIIVWYGEKR